MDIRNYIESGILEEYVLGKLSSEAAAAVEENARLYPTIKQELDAIELALERYSFLHAKTPPPGTLENILKQIEPTTVSHTTSSSWLSRLRPRSWAKFLAVGMTIKFVLVSAGLIALYFQNQKLHERLETRQYQMTRMQVACDSVSTLFERELQFFKDVATQPVALSGTSVSPQSLATLHFNVEAQKAFLTSINLPQPPAGKQYQLWAIVKGTPVSMGVFEFPISENRLLEVPFIANASAFAISLEEKGGKPQPTADQIYVLGAVSS